MELTPKQRNTILIALTRRIMELIATYYRTGHEYFATELDDANDAYKALMGCDHEDYEKFRAEQDIINIVTGGM